MLVVFDLDGTLWDSERKIAQADFESLLHIGWVTPGGADFIENALRGKRSRPKFDAVAALLKRTPSDELYTIYRAERNRRIDADIAAAAYPLFEGVRATLDHIAAGARLALVSNNPPERSKAGLRAHGLEHLIPPNLAIGPVEGELRGKPAPDMLNHVMRLAGARPKETFYVGDSVDDIQTARAAGAYAIGYVNPSIRDPRAHGTALLRAGAHALIDQHAAGLWDARTRTLRHAASKPVPVL